MSVSLNLSQTGAPSVEPLTAQEVSDFLRIDSPDESTYIDLLIQAARSAAEDYTGRQLITATWKWYCDEWPVDSDGAIWVPKPNLLTVTSITYVDPEGTTQTWSASEYSVDIVSVPGRITEAYGYTYPTARSIENAITITYTAGYGATASTVPARLRLGMLHMIAHWYETREPVNIGNIVNPLPDMGKQLLDEFWHGRIW